MHGLHGVLPGVLVASLSGAPLILRSRLFAAATLIMASSTLHCFSHCHSVETRYSGDGTFQDLARTGSPFGIRYRVDLDEIDLHRSSSHDFHFKGLPSARRWIFGFEIRASEHRDELIVFFVILDNALKHLGCFIGCASGDVSFEHAAQRFSIVAH